MPGEELGIGHQCIVELERRMHRASLSDLVLFTMAEGEGFEPSRRCYRLRDFQSRALGQAMRPFHVGYRLLAIGRGSLLDLTDSPTHRLTDFAPAERVGFEPTVAH